jgi:endonuclease/exonuclease/phosphatase (EEP) superfamily protein YafD
MRFLTWNCRKGGGNKLNAIKAESPDVALIQECSKVAIEAPPTGYRGLWLAGEPLAGIGLLVREPFSAQKLSTSSIPHFVTVRVDGPVPFQLIAVWNCKLGRVGYDKQLHVFLDEHAGGFDGPTILAGDLNSPTNASSSIASHRRFAERLKDLGLVNAYEVSLNGRPEAAKQPTFRRGTVTPQYFHIDYIYLSDGWLPNISSIRIGEERCWSSWSDHFPVILAIANESRSRQLKLDS